MEVVESKKLTFKGKSLLLGHCIVYEIDLWSYDLGIDFVLRNSLMELLS